MWKVESSQDNDANHTILAIVASLLSQIVNVRCEDMKTLTNVLLLFLALLLASSCATLMEATERHWRDRIAAVRVGMERGEVEKLLPVYCPSGVSASGSKWVNYWVDEHWLVEVQYDHFMTSQEEATRGPGSGTYSPHNRVMSKPVLSRKDCPFGRAPSEFQTLD